MPYPERIAVTASGSGLLLRPDDATETTGQAARSGMTFAPGHEAAG